MNNNRIITLLFGLALNFVFFVHTAYSVCVDIHHLESDLNYVQIRKSSRLEKQERSLSKPLVVSFFDIEQSVYSHVLLVDTAQTDKKVCHFSGKNSCSLIAEITRQCPSVSKLFSEDYLSLLDQLDFSIEFISSTNIKVNIKKIGDNSFLCIDGDIAYTRENIKEKRNVLLLRNFLYSTSDIYQDANDPNVFNWEVINRRKTTNHALKFYPLSYDQEFEDFMFDSSYYNEKHKTWSYYPVNGIPGTNLKNWLDETAADIGFVVRGLEKQASKLNAQDNGFDGIYFLWDNERIRLQNVVVSESKYAESMTKTKQALLAKFDVSETSALSRMISGDLIRTGAIVQEFILKFSECLILYGIDMKEDGAIAGEYGNFYSMTSWNPQDFNNWIKTQRARRIKFDAFLQRKIEPLLPLPQDSTKQLDHAAVVSPEDQIRIELAKEFLETQDLDTTLVCGKEIKLARKFLNFLCDNKLSNRNQTQKHEKIAKIFGCSSSTVRRFLVEKKDCKDALSTPLTNLLNKVITEILSKRSISEVTSNSCEATSVAEAKVEIEETDTKKEPLIIATDLRRNVFEVKSEFQRPLDTESESPIPFTPKTFKSTATATLSSPTSVVSLPLLTPQSSEKARVDFYHKVIQLAMQSTGNSIEQIQREFNASFVEFSEEKDPLENMYQVTSNGSFSSPIKSQEK